MNTTLLDQLRELLRLAALALADPRPRRKFVDLALGLLCGPKPKTLTSALEWLGQQAEDWSADYRLFSQTHWEKRKPLSSPCSPRRWPIRPVAARGSISARTIPSCARPAAKSRG
jgi:hypothetical protein